MKTVKDLNISDYCYGISEHGVVYIYKVLEKISYTPRFPDLYEVKLLDTKTNKKITFHNIPGDEIVIVGYSQVVFLTYDKVVERINIWISYFNDVKLEIENLNKD